MVIKRLFLLPVFVFLLSSCAATENSSNEHKKTVYAMDTVMEIKAYGDNAEEAINEAEKEIFRLERLFKRDSEESDVYKLNKYKKAVVSADTADVVKKALDISEATEGAFDISIAPLTDLWGFYTKEYRVPSQKKIDSVLPQVNYKNIGVDGNFAVISGNSEIDLGGIAKGYLSEKITEGFRKAGVTSAIVSLGGNIQTLGNKPDGGKWQVAIQNPDSDNSYIGILSVSDMAVVTSGGYRRFFEKDGKIYHHIFDTKTGYPANGGLKSVTIVCFDGTRADGLSTALFVMGLDRGTEFWRADKGFDAIFLTDDNKIFVTEGIESMFKSDYPFETIY
ncbi:MAG: FAD:protein FMN transferase [Clostridia bacterium]|nr:FAD:protein FMN transferase [Clostridia bacterium]